MSRFFSAKYAALTPYTPGEQPTAMKYTKLNTNELPFPPSVKAKEYAASVQRELNLYPELECTALRGKIAEMYNISPDEVLMNNGSDETLNFAFMAFCDAQKGAAFPDISYGFYPVFAQLNGVPYVEIPLKEDFSIDPKDYYDLHRTIFIANPNAPTGRILSPEEIEGIICANRDSVVVIDEAYIDFGGKSCVPLIKKYDNLLVVQTFSKSRAMAGARLGFGMGCRELIGDLNTIKYSTNPYNINSMTMAMGLGLLMDEETTRKNCTEIQKNREYTSEALRDLGFRVLPSTANFVFAETDAMEGGELYRRLKERGVLVRHFDKPRISNFNRITIADRNSMDVFLDTVRKILEEAK